MVRRARWCVCVGGVRAHVGVRHGRRPLPGPGCCLHVCPAHACPQAHGACTGRRTGGRTSSCVRPAFAGSYVAPGPLRPPPSGSVSDRAAACISSLTTCARLGFGGPPLACAAQLLAALAVPEGARAPCAPAAVTAEARGAGLAFSSFQISSMLFFWAILAQRAQAAVHRAGGAAAALRLPSCCCQAQTWVARPLRQALRQACWPAALAEQRAGDAALGVQRPPGRAGSPRRCAGAAGPRWGGLAVLLDGEGAGIGSTHSFGVYSQFGKAHTSPCTQQWAGRRRRPPRSPPSWLRSAQSTGAPPPESR